ncbi:MAG: hypothetical protein ACUVTO_02540 [Candidatus Caldatribacteriaceae bacterium]
MLGREHSKLLTEEKPTVKFLTVLDAMFTQGEAHLQDRITGGEPDSGERWGWRGGEARGALLGWVDEECVYLLLDASYRAVCEYLRFEGFPIRERTLRENLMTEGWLISNDGRSSNVVRAEGRIQRVISIPRAKLMALFSVQSGNNGNRG